MGQGIVNQKSRGYLSPIVEAQVGNEGRHQQYKDLLQVISTLKGGSNEFDVALSEILAKAARLAVKREHLIDSILDPEVDISTKVKSYSELQGLRSEAVGIVYDCVLNRLGNNLSSNQLGKSLKSIQQVYTVTEITSSLGYYHPVSRTRDYSQRPLSVEEKERSLEPSTIIEINSKIREEVLELVLAAVQTSEYLQQYSVIFSGESRDLGESYRPGEIVEVEGVSILNSVQHDINLWESCFKVKDLDEILSKEQVSYFLELLTSQDNYALIAQLLARRGFAGATFRGTNLSLFYIPAWDPIKSDNLARPYYGDIGSKRAWSEDLELAFADIQSFLYQVLQETFDLYLSKDSIIREVPKQIVKQVPLLILSKFAEHGLDSYDYYIKRSYQSRSKIIEYMSK